jgi:hypothetical protein
VEEAAMVAWWGFLSLGLERWEEKKRHEGLEKLLARIQVFIKTGHVCFRNKKGLAWWER